MENEQKLHCQTKPRLVSSQVITPHSLSTVQKRRLPRAYGQGSAPHQSPQQKSREQHQRREVSLTLEKQWSFAKRDFEGSLTEIYLGCRGWKGLFAFHAPLHPSHQSQIQIPNLLDNSWKQRLIHEGSMDYGDSE